MGWQDRDYYRERRDPNDFVARLLAFFNSSYSLGTYRGIRIRAHFTFLFAAIALALYTQSIVYAGRLMAVLFLSVIAHEFGHALACRTVRGYCDEVVIWPLGGLAECRPPRKVIPEFFTVICGPLVNVLIASFAYLGVCLWIDVASAHKMVNFGFLWKLQAPTTTSIPGFEGFLYDLFLVNFALSIFNLFLLCYPFDCGRIIQIVLSNWIGYVNSLRVVSVLGMFFAIVMVLIGVYNYQMMIMGVAIFGFYACYQKYRQLEDREVVEELEFEGAAMAREEQETIRKGWLEAWRERREIARREREREILEKLNQEVDAILDKVREKGLQSLTTAEQQKLREATERQRRAG